MKIIGCVVTIIVGLALTSILYYYLSLYREAPWTYFYYFERPLIWILVALVCTCILSRTASDWVGMFIGNWIRAGGFWAFWTKNNTFGVTWVVIAVILTWNAIAYGPGSSKADWVKIQYDAKGLIVEAVSQPEDQSTVGGIKGTVNYLAQGFLGKDVIDPKESQPEDQSTIGGIKGTVNYLAQGFLGKDVIASGDEAKKVESLLPRLAQGFLGKDVIDPKGGEAKEVEALLPRYEKGWWRIWAALLAILIAPLALIWCWRDEMHDHVSAFADWFRTKPNTNGSATSSSGGGSSNILKKLVNQTDAGDQITNHLIGDLLSRAAEMFVGTFAKLMKKY